MAGLYSSFKTNPDFEKSGICLDFGTSKVWIARAGGANERFTKRMADLFKPHRRSIQLDTMDSKLSDKLIMQAYAEAIVLKWENVTDEAGKSLDFNVENCVKVFTDLPDFFHEILKASNNAALFRAEYLEGDAKN